MRLNLGSGANPLDGYVNCDKFGSPDVLHDLETFPWPWEDESAGEVRMHHVLEHLGESRDVFLRIMQELYRVCKPGAKVVINVPHYRHEDFWNDPTHVRVITPEMLQHFSRASNRKDIEGGHSDTPLGLHYGVDFEVESVRLGLEEPWLSKYRSGELSAEVINAESKRSWGVVKEWEIVLRRV